MLTGLVGRDRELRLVLDRVDDCLTGRGSVVVCVGEPGVGKTRFAEEVRRFAEDRGMRVGWGRPDSIGGAPPYWPWQRVLRDVIGDDALLDTRRGDGSQGFEERLRQFDLVASQLAEAAARQPLLLVVDDLHAAGEPAQLLALHLARCCRSERLLLLVTAIDLSGPLSLLAREAPGIQVQLTGLGVEDVRRQMSGLLRRDPADDELATVYDATTGNPFLVAELTQQIMAGRGLYDGIPRSVRDAIAVRIARLSDGCFSTLQAAAVLGADFPVSLLAQVTRGHVRDSLTFLDEAQRAALARRGDSPDVWRFEHGLIRDAILTDLEAARRAQLHRRAAEALEPADAVSSDSVLFELARHWSEAAVAADPVRAACWIERAGHRAMRLHAYEDARRWFGRALTLIVGGGEHRATLLIAFAKAQALSGDYAEALSTCGKVVELAARIGRPDLAGAAVLVPEPSFDPQIDRVIRTLCEQALELLHPASEPITRARVLAQYAVVCDHLSDLDAAHLAIAESVALAERSDDSSALEAALTARHLVRSGPDGLAEREADADRLSDLASRTGNAATQLAAAEWRFDAAFERGDLAGAAREVEVIGRWADRVGGPVARWRRLHHSAVLAQAQGRFGDAQLLGRSALAAAPSYPVTHMLWSGLLCTLGHQTGQTDESLAANGVPESDADQVYWPTAGVIMTLAPACQLAELGRLRESALIYRRLGPPADWLESPHAQLFTWAYGILTTVILGLDEDVAALHARLDAYRGHHIVNGRYAMAYCGPAELWLGVAAAHLGLLDDAVADLESAAKACLANGAHGFRAEAGYQLAAALARRSGPGDRFRSRGLLVEALALMTELGGMPPIQARAQALLAELDADRPGTLTRRESEVADLVAEGLTNRQIAERLHLSERTAQNHVQHILDKLGVNTRSAVAAWAVGATAHSPAAARPSTSSGTTSGQ